MNLYPFVSLNNALVSQYMAHIDTHTFISRF